MVTLGEEDDALEDIREGIEIAMSDRGYEGGDVDDIKFNKLAYFAIQEYGLPITYGWYKYGPAPVNVANRNVNISPRSKGETPATNQPRIRRSSDFLSPEEYYYFFRDDLEEFEGIMQTETKEYLTGFYFEDAPDEYRDLYIAGAELQKVLDEVKEDASWHDEHEEVITLLNRRLPRVLHEVASNPKLDESEEAVRRYGNLLMEVIVTASEMKGLDEAQQRFIRNVVDYFYGGVWKYVALLISRDTVDLSPGENQDRLLNSIEDDLKRIRAGYGKEVSRLEQEADEHGLTSDSAGVRVGSAEMFEEEDGFDESDTMSVDDVLEELG
jgi:hypothetical protein